LRASAVKVGAHFAATFAVGVILKNDIRLPSVVLFVPAKIYIFPKYKTHIFAAPATFPWADGALRAKNLQIADQASLRSILSAVWYLSPGLMPH